MKSLLNALLACATLLAAARTSAAEPWETLAVVALPSVSRLRTNLEFLGAAIDRPNLDAAVARKLAKLSGCRDLKGIDPARPWGIVVRTDGLEVVPFLVLPVTDEEAFLASVEPLVGPAEQGAGAVKIGRRTLTGYFRSQDRWAFVAQSAADLAHLPDPTALAAAAPDDADGGMLLHVRRLPEALRTMVIDTLRARQAVPDPGPANEAGLAANLRKRAGELQSMAWEALFAQVDTLYATWGLDRPAKRLSMEMRLAPVAGSGLSDAAARLRPLPMPMTASDDEVLSLTLSGEPADDAGEARNAEAAAIPSDLADLFGDDSGIASDIERDLLRELAVGLSDTCRRVLAGGRWQAAVQAGKRGSYRLLAVAPAASNDQLARAVAAISQQGGPAPRFALLQVGVERDGEIPVHHMPLRGLKADHPLAKLCGVEAVLHMALARDQVWLALGPESLPWLKQSLATAATETVPIHLSLRLASALRTAERFSSGEAAAFFRLTSANLNAGNDRVTLDVQGATEAMRVRLDAGDGVLRAAALTLALAVFDELTETP